MRCSRDLKSLFWIGKVRNKRVGIRHSWLQIVYNVWVRWWYGDTTHLEVLHSDSILLLTLISLAFRHEQENISSFGPGWYCLTSNGFVLVCVPQYINNSIDVQGFAICRRKNGHSGRLPLPLFFWSLIFIHFLPLLFIFSLPVDTSSTKIYSVFQYTKLHRRHCTTTCASAQGIASCT